MREEVQVGISARDERRIWQLTVSNKTDKVEKDKDGDK